MNLADLTNNQLFVTTDFSRFGTAVMQDGVPTGNYRFQVIFGDGTMSFKAAMPRLDVGAVKLVYREAEIDNKPVKFLQLLDAVNSVAEATAKVALRETLAAVPMF